VVGSNGYGDNEQHEAGERLVPSIFELNVTSAVLAVISDQQTKKTHDVISIRGRSDQLSASKRVKSPRSAEI
jgi:hypothetical protein